MDIANAYEKIVRDSLQHVACIDDDFIDPYTCTKEVDKEKQEFTQKMYDNLKERCDGHVELQRYYGGIDAGILDKCMRNKDLLVLDWELTGGNDKAVLEIIARAVGLQIPFICIYTNRSDVENIYPIICSYFSGYTNASVEEICDKWMGVGVFEEEFKTDVEDLFAGSGRKLYELKEHFSQESEEIRKTLKDLGYDKKESWYPLLLKWNNAILPDEPFPIAANLSNEAVIIDGKVIICLSKSNSGSEKSVCINELILSIARHITNVPNSVFDIIWLNYTNSLRRVLQARTNLFSGIDAKALGYFAKGLLDESIETFDDFMKGLYRDEIMDCLDGQEISLPECIIEDLKRDYSGINPHNYANQLIELNEKITVNHLYSGVRHKVDFGDLFVVEQGGKERTFWLCVTAKCECLRENKIDNNYLFIEGEQILNASKALKNAESEFRSFVKYKGEIVSISWFGKLRSVYIRSGENIIDGIGKTVTGCYQGNNLNYTYICNLKENYAQRMANEAFSKGNKVGITLAQIRKKEEEP
jgi:hypothetical protein